MTDRFDPAALNQEWPLPSSPRPIVTFGAGSIVGDAHFPAYRKAGLPVAAARVSSRRRERGPAVPPSMAGGHTRRLGKARQT